MHHELTGRVGPSPGLHLALLVQSDRIHRRKLYLTAYKPISQSDKKRLDHGHTVAVPITKLFISIKGDDITVVTTTVAHPGLTEPLVAPLQGPITAHLQRST